MFDGSMVNRPPPRFKPDNGLPSKVRNKEIEAERQFESTLSEQQLQVLEQENNSMLEGFERTMDQIKYKPAEQFHFWLTRSGAQRKRYWKSRLYKMNL